MKTKYKYIHFEEEQNPGRKTTKWNCLNSNSGNLLGYVEWYGAWRQYTFSTYSPAFSYEYINIILNKGCLDDISDFLDQLNKAQRSKWKSKGGSWCH